jgi:hypothetical protein
MELKLDDATDFFGVGLGDAHRDQEVGPDRLRPSSELRPSARFSSAGVGACVAALSRRCCIGDRIGEGFGETIIAPVVHMQPVLRKECLEWHTIDVVPVPHESKAVKHVDVFLRGNTRN